jgi:uncharacterized protein YdiU (UPF0061 family)
MQLGQTRVAVDSHYPRIQKRYRRSASFSAIRLSWGVVIGLILLCNLSSISSSSSSSSSTLFVSAFMIVPRLARNMSSSSTAAGSRTASSSALSWANKNFNFCNSWLEQLSPETPEHLEQSLQQSGGINNADNKNKRPVFDGHYVLVKPTPLRQPRLVIYSPQVAQSLGLGVPSEDQKSVMQSDELAHFFSGTVTDTASWATPYALSIMGTRYTSNCPYKTGNGYGDGRAISLGEVTGVAVPPHKNDANANANNGASASTIPTTWEMQLKGAGRTPFCRGADGRAVLRSSIREFLASEAMYYLGISTTRALSLVVSDVDTVQRAWYSGDNKQGELPSLDDPRLARYTMEQRKQLLVQLSAQQKNDPDMMIQEPCAITCRVAPSFCRIGHLDLFARRVTNQHQKNKAYDDSTLEWKELEQMAWHAMYREFRSTAYDPHFASRNMGQAGQVFLEEAAQRLANMVAGWIRVGFAQGNFNADNCLVGGHTMDYGPFGFMDEYSPLFAKWTGSGDHFGFMNQPSAGYANYMVLVESMLPLICHSLGYDTDPNDSRTKELVNRITTRAQDMFQTAVDETFRTKLGFPATEEAADEVWESLEPLMRISRTDWTLFWRQLTYLAQAMEQSSPDRKIMTGPQMWEWLVGTEEANPGSSPFYQVVSADEQKRWMAWLEQWRDALQAVSMAPAFVVNDNKDGGSSVFETMKRANPKYTLREWMLVDAYTKAAQRDEGMIHELFALLQNAYEEGTPEQHERFYRRAPDAALKAGGTAFMS